MVRRGIVAVAAVLLVSTGCSDSPDPSAGVAGTTPGSETSATTAPGCDTSNASTCALRQLADLQGVLIGTAVVPSLFDEEPEYSEILAAEFNSVTPENAYKWPSTEPEQGVYTWGDADAVAEFAVLHDQRIRGHTLVWPNSFSAQQYEVLPAYVDGAPDPEALQQYVDEHIEAVVTRYAEVTDRWDVVNEPLVTVGAGVDSNVLTDTLGEEWMVRAFRQTRELDPDAALFVNETLAERPGAKHDALLSLVGRLLDAGAPIDGVGLQGHFLLGAPSVDELTSVMEDWEELGLEVAVTELDIVTPDGDAQAQAQMYADVFTACLAVAACGEITLWGFTDAHTWVDGFVGTESNPLLFDEEYRPKPAYQAVRETLAAGL